MSYDPNGYAFQYCYNPAGPRYDDNAWTVQGNLEGIDIQWQPQLLATEETLLRSVAGDNISVRITHGLAVDLIIIAFQPRNRMPSE